MDVDHVLQVEGIVAAASGVCPPEPVLHFVQLLQGYALGLTAEMRIIADRPTRDRALQPGAQVDPSPRLRLHPLEVIGEGHLTPLRR
jgi:hypothetical protein